MRNVRLFGMMDDVQQSLKNDLKKYFPHLSIFEESQEIQSLQIDLTFFFTNIENYNQYSQVESKLNGQAYIWVGKKKELAYHAIKCAASDFLLYPYQPEDLIGIVNKLFHGRKSEQPKVSLNGDLKNKFICVPCLEGYEFVNMEEIVVCEGMQSYTKIIKRNGAYVVSSSNIGELRKKLEPHNFFSPHKSYLINLEEIRKYSREGVIYLSHGYHVPLARRKKSDFLKLVSHL